MSDVLTNALQLIFGFVLLIKGADVLVDGASTIARRFGVSNVVIGLTIVAFGTSAPELLVSMMANLQGGEGIAVGNVLGSNVANLLLILGATALIKSLPVPKPSACFEIPFSLVAMLVTWGLISDGWSGGESMLSRTDGFILLGLFGVFFVYLYDQVRRHKHRDLDPPAEHGPYSPVKSGIMVFIGIAGLAWGGDLIVDGATSVARQLDVSDTLIGLTLVAFGTSLPELATSIIAARKGETDIAIGNVIGSNIFNLLWVLALSATIRPFNFSAENTKVWYASNHFDMLTTCMATLGLFICLFIGKRFTFKRWQGIVFLCAYVGYIAHLIHHAK